MARLGTRWPRTARTRPAAERKPRVTQRQHVCSLESSHRIQVEWGISFPLLTEVGSQDLRLCFEATAGLGKERRIQLAKV